MKQEKRGRFPGYIQYRKCVTLLGWQKNLAFDSILKTTDLSKTKKNKNKIATIIENPIFNVSVLKYT